MNNFLAFARDVWQLPRPADRCAIKSLAIPTGLAEIHRMATHHPTLLRLPAVCAQIGLSKSQIYRLIRAHEFPAPVHLGSNSVAWVAEQVHAWIEEKIAAGHSA